MSVPSSADHHLCCMALSLPHYHTRIPRNSLSILEPRLDSGGSDNLKLKPRSVLEEAAEANVDRGHRRSSHRSSTCVPQQSTEVKNPDATPDDRLSRSNSLPKEETGESRNAVLTMAFNPVSPTTCQPEDNDLTSSFPLAPTSDYHKDRKRVRNKPKPNLRINIGDHAMDDRPPPPPPKSPRRIPTPASGSAKNDPKSPSSAGIAKVGFDSVTPVVPSVAVQASFLPLGADLKVREVNMQSIAARERPARKLLPQFLSSVSTGATERPSLVRKPVNRLIGAPSELSPDSATDASLQFPSIRSASPTEVSKSESPVDDAQKRRYVAYRPPTAPQSSSDIESSSDRTASLPWTSRVDSLQTSISARPALLDDVPLIPRLDGTRSAPPADISGDHPNNTTVRHITAGPLNSNPYIPSPMLPPTSNATILEPTTFSRSQTPSPIRLSSNETVAPVYVDVTSAGSPKISNQNRTSPPDSSTGAFSRAITPEPSSTASSIAFMDPVERLKELTEKCEVLHAKYASLRADRQKISSGIIASLKAAAPTAETMSALLNEQLSLAATSSAMDICFAKLQALECQKEDAVTTLIAQTVNLRRTAIDSIAGSPARNITHPRNQHAPTLEPLARFGQLHPGCIEPERFLQPNRSLLENEVTSDTRDIASPVQEMTPRANGQQSLFGFPTNFHVSPRSDSVISGHLPKEPALEHDLSQVREDPDKVSMSVLEKLLPGQVLDERAHRVRVDGPKAVKILGLLAQSDSRKAPSSARKPDGFEEMLLRKKPELELEISSVVKSQAPQDGESYLQDEISPSSTPGEEMDQIDPLDLYTDSHSLRLSTPDAETALPVLPSARYGCPVRDPVQQKPSDASEVPSSPKSLKSVKSFKSIKSYKSTKRGYLHQTIKVFMDDDILEYYRALQGYSQGS